MNFFMPAYVIRIDAAKRKKYFQKVMSQFTFTETIVETFRVVSCYTCGARFGIGSQLFQRVVTDAKGSVFCPACGRGTCW